MLRRGRCAAHARRPLGDLRCRQAPAPAQAHAPGAAMLRHRARMRMSRRRQQGGCGGWLCRSRRRRQGGAEGHAACSMQRGLRPPTPLAARARIAAAAAAPHSVASAVLSSAQSREGFRARRRGRLGARRPPLSVLLTCEPGRLRWQGSGVLGRAEHGLPSVPRPAVHRGAGPPGGCAAEFGSCVT
jgi:hypothetical protein